MKYALIDMGSNSIRLTVYDLKENGFKVLFKKRIMAGLAAFVVNGALSQEGIDCACHSLQTFQTTLASLQIDFLSVFATASLRNISNTEHALKQIQQTTDITVEVLSGETEAECGYYGAANEVSVKDGLFVDIGGASVELAQFTNGALEKVESVPVGSLKLYHDCVKNILPGEGSRKRIKAAIEQAFDESSMDDFPVRAQMIGVGGTIRAALRLCIRMYGLPEQAESFDRNQLKGLIRKLCKRDKEAIDFILLQEPERIHTIIPGLMLLHYLMERFEVETVTVSYQGVREGYLLQKIQPLLTNNSTDKQEIEEASSIRSEAPDMAESPVENFSEEGDSIEYTPDGDATGTEEAEE